MNLSLLLDMAADGFGDRVLIGHRADGLSADRLRRLTIRGAESIRAAGADAVVYLGVNGPMFPIALFSAARAGVPLIPINYRLGDEQLQALLANHPNALGLGGPSELAQLEAAGIKSHLMSDWFDTIAADADSAEDLPADETDAPAVVIYTSGTTSAPKGVVLRHHNLVSYVFGSVEFAGAEADEATVISVPPYHIAAVANAISNLYSGRRTIVLEQFTGPQWLDLVRSEEITHALVVPTMLAKIMEAPEQDLPVPSLRSLAYGGASMPAHIIRRALEQWPGVGFVNAYGLTETSSTIAVLGPEDHRTCLSSEDPFVRARIASAGQVLPMVELEIRDELGSAVPAGETGRIFVRGEQVSGEYTGTGPAIGADGFFDTRDRGYLDADGYLFIAGRADDTIIRGAENIAPAEIEDVLLRHDDVEDAVVVGIPDELWGQHLEAAVVLRPSAKVEPEELREYVRSHLRGSKTPDRIVLWSELPRTETGKLVRRVAVERLVSEPS